MSRSTVYWIVRAVLVAAAVVGAVVTGSPATALPLLVLVGLSFLAERPLRR